MTNSDSISDIVKKARDLSIAIKSHPAYIKHMESQRLFSKDPAAQNIYSRLVMIGKTIAEETAQNRHEPGENAELRLIQEEIEHLPAVKEYITNQKEYLNLLREITERIRIN
jgi:cell fate (sporulation/competence/biofilm development) regulator YlbF (YheA/YmcA/DUF963 family)